MNQFVLNRRILYDHQKLLTFPNCKCAQQWTPLVHHSCHAEYTTEDAFSRSEAWLVVHYCQIFYRVAERFEESLPRRPSVRQLIKVRHSSGMGIHSQRSIKFIVWKDSHISNIVSKYTSLICSCHRQFGTRCRLGLLGFLPLCHDGESILFMRVWLIPLILTQYDYFCLLPSVD
jgi:hypothetical protein